MTGYWPQCSLYNVTRSLPEAEAGGGVGGGAAADGAGGGRPCYALPQRNACLAIGKSANKLNI